MNLQAKQMVTNASLWRRVGGVDNIAVDWHLLEKLV
jgi:hypothetical protein